MFKSRKNLKGFTLLEGLAVIMIVVLLFALAGSFFMRMIIQANEVEVVSSLAKLSAALEVYRTLYKTYPQNLSYLSTVNPTLSAGTLLSSGSKLGYNYQLEPGTFSRNTFEVIAIPKVEGLTGKHKYKIDQSGNLYRADTVATIVWSYYNPSGDSTAIAGEGQPASADK